MNQRFGEGVLEPVQQSFHELILIFLLCWLRRLGKEKALLAIVAGEHGLIRRCQVEGLLGFFWRVMRFDETLSDVLNSWKTHFLSLFCPFLFVSGFCNGAFAY